MFIFPESGSRHTKGVFSGLLALEENARLLPALSGKRIFITGGTGFFGYWMLSLLEELNSQGAGIGVVCQTRDSERFAFRAGKMANHQWLEVVEGDIVSWSGRVDADLAIHAATDTNATAHSDPSRIMREVFSGTVNVLDSLSSSGVSKCLYVSSGAVYGASPVGMATVREDSGLSCDCLSPSSAYGEAKRAAEQYCLQFGATKGMTIPIARCFAFAGPGLDLNGHFAAGNFVRDALAGNGIRVSGDGSAVRGYLYGADLAIWLFSILMFGEHGRAYNVGSDEAISMADLARDLDSSLNGGGVSIAGARESSPRSVYVPNIDRARDELGLTVWTKRAECFELMADWARSGVSC